MKGVELNLQWSLRKNECNARTLLTNSCDQYIEKKNLNLLNIIYCRQFMERENLQIHLRCKFTSQSRGDRRRAETNEGRRTVEDTELPGAKQKYKVDRS